MLSRSVQFNEEILTLVISGAHDELLGTAWTKDDSSF